ncbi:hypothetical protein [Cytobacillus gottheilii]|uniref:Mobilization protein n=1 Tax=Cytobacillus gottheilii TaxID=859144 RepID=A0ABX8FIT5_9BACI|nr:hypothetical protein [Cytobacillus gottheilii]QVY63931.1 hypothetical protein J1899_22420 [Cytobacillus gottheilii]
MSSRVFIKNRIPTKNVSTTKRGVYYIGVDSKDISKENQKQWFGPEEDLIRDPKRFVDRVKNHRALKHSKSVKSHHMIFSLRKMDYDAYKRSGKDYKDIIRAVLNDYEKKHSVKLDWVAHIHDTNMAENHPHCHVIIKGVSDTLGDRGHKRIYMTKQDIDSMKKDFDLELDRHAQYKFMEREDIQTLSKDLGKSFESALQNLAFEAEKKKRESELERSKKVRKNKERGRSR